MNFNMHGGYDMGLGQTHLDFENVYFCEENTKLGKMWQFWSR